MALARTNTLFFQLQFVQECVKNGGENFYSEQIDDQLVLKPSHNKPDPVNPGQLEAQPEPTSQHEPSSTQRSDPTTHIADQPSHSSQTTAPQKALIAPHRIRKPTGLADTLRWLNKDGKNVPDAPTVDSFTHQLNPLLD